MRQMLDRREASAFARVIVSHAGDQVFDIRIRPVAHHRKESELLPSHVGEKVILKVDQRLCKPQGRGAMRAVNVLYLLGKRDQPFQIVAVRLVISLKNVCDKLAGAIRSVAPCCKLERLKTSKKIIRFYAGICCRIRKRHVAATAKADTLLPEKFGSARKFACDHSDRGVQVIFSQCALLDAWEVTIRKRC